MKRITNDTNGRVRFSLGAELISMGDTVLTNVNGKEYVVATCKFTDVKGIERVVTAMVYSGNYNHKDANFVPGTKYLTTATITERDGKPSVIMQMSHLVYTEGELATADMFDVEEADEVSSRPAVVSGVVTN